MKKTLLFLGLGLFATSAAHAQILNGSMEAWHSYTTGGANLEAPDNWHGLDSNIAAVGFVTPQKQLFKSTDKHAGSFAAQLVSKNYSLVNRVVPGVMSNADVSLTIVPTVSYSSANGTPVSQRHGAVTAWVKYVPGAATDSATIGVQAILKGTMGANGSDSVIGYGAMTFSARSTYTQMTVPIVYSNATRTPTHIQIGFTSGRLDGGTDGSTLYVDDVALTAPSGIRQSVFNAAVVKCYPNPATGTLNISSNQPETLTWEALNVAGQVIANKTFTQNATVDLSNAPAGIYFYRVFDKQNTLVQTGKFNLQ